MPNLPSGLQCSLSLGAAGVALLGTQYPGDGRAWIVYAGHAWHTDPAAKSIDLYIRGNLKNGMCPVAIASNQSVVTNQALVLFRPVILPPNCQFAVATSDGVIAAGAALNMNFWYWQIPDHEMGGWVPFLL